MVRSTESIDENEGIKKMRIGIDARVLTYSLTGTGRYLSSILNELQKMTDADEFFLYAHKDILWHPQKDRWHERIGRFNHKDFHTLWMFSKGRQMVIEDKIDVFWAPWPFLPPFLPMKKIVTVHDFVWKLFPETMHPLQWGLYNIMASAGIFSADAVFVVSESTSKDLKRFYPGAKNVHLTYNAVNSGFRRLNRMDAADHVRKKFGIRSKYILNVGTLEPRKNLDKLLRALVLMPKDLLGDLCLVIVGGRGWKESRIFHLYNQLGLQDKVIFLGYVDDQDLPWLYNAAEFFVFPSFYEGFGIPPLEAMACGCASIVSDRPALPEVVRDGAVFVDPDDPQDIANKMEYLLRNPLAIEELREKGAGLAKRFSWERSAQNILQIFKDIGRDLR